MARGNEHRGAVGHGRVGIAGRTCDRGYTMRLHVIARSLAELIRQSGSGVALDIVGNDEYGLHYRRRRVR